jgi:hypothetical protein
MPIAVALPYIAAAATVAQTANTISASRKAQSASNDALAGQRALVGDLKYQPIDIEKLKADTHEQAVTNATQSLALERALQPDVAATREGLAKTVSHDLSLGGKLSPDVMNQVARAARTTGSLSGAPAGPITAASIGSTAEALKQQRMGNAAQLLGQNQLQPAGLDPGTLASEQVAQNAAMNQFNLAKAGVGSNLVNSTANVAGSNAGLQSGIGGSIVNLIKALPGMIPGLGTGAAPSSKPPQQEEINPYVIPVGS